MGSISLGTKIFVVLLIVGLLMILTSVGDSIKLLKDGSTMITKLDMDDYDTGDMVTGKVEYVFDTIATLETSNTLYGIPYNKSTTPYYLIYVNGDTKYSEDRYGYYILLHATSEDTIKTLNNIMVDTQNALTDQTGNYYMNTKGISMSTKAVSTPNEVKEYLYEYFAEADYTRTEMEKFVVVDVTLEQKDYAMTKILPLIGLGVMVIPTIIFILSRKNANKYKSTRTTYVNEGPSTESLMSEYNTAPAQSGVRRYSPESYAGGSSGSTPGEMDSIDTDGIFDRKL